MDDGSQQIHLDLRRSSLRLTVACGGVPPALTHRGSDVMSISAPLITDMNLLVLLDAAADGLIPV